MLSDSYPLHARGLNAWLPDPNDNRIVNSLDFLPVLDFWQRVCMPWSRRRAYHPCIEPIVGSRQTQHWIRYRSLVRGPLACSASFLHSSFEISRGKA